MKRKKRKINTKIIENIIPKDLNLSPIKVLSNTKKKVTNYLDIMHKLEPPEPNKDCCGIMHNFFYDKKKLKKL